MSKPVLYVGLHGPILVRDVDHQDSFLMHKIVDYAKPFMHWATNHFDVRWLSETGARDALYTAQRLSLPQDAVSVASFEDSKVDALHPREDFFWLDGELIPSEVAWLRQHRHEHRFVHIDPRIGVTPEHKKMLEQKLRR